MGVHLVVVILYIAVVPLVLSLIVRLLVAGVAINNIDLDLYLHPNAASDPFYRLVFSLILKGTLLPSNVDCTATR